MPIQYAALRLAPWLICGAIAVVGITASNARAAEHVALISAVGDQVSFVRERAATGRIDNTFRNHITLKGDAGQAINIAILKGLDRAIAKESPTSKRTYLLWTTPTNTADALTNARGEERNSILLDAVILFIAGIPQRQQWDRIEVVVPRYFSGEREGMGRKLGGVGIYVQPIQNFHVEFSENGDVSTSDVDGDNTTIDPRTGKRGNSSTFVAPFFYVDRVTLNAKTLDIVKRTASFDNIKYYDPMSAALDVGDQMPVTDLVLKLQDLAEKAAYRSIRGVRPEVEVGPLLPSDAVRNQ